MKWHIRIVVALAAAATHAGTVTWDGSTDMDWTQPDSTSWSGATYQSNDVAELLGAGAGTVTVDAGGVTPGGIRVDAGGNYTFSGGSIGGTGTLFKAGSGTLTLTGSNTFTGGTVISGGVVDVNADVNLGTTNTPIIFNASSTLRNDLGGNRAIDLGARPIALNNGAVATFRLGRGNSFRTTGDVTGDGGVAIQVSGGNSPKVYLLSTNNTFTGPIDIRSGSDRPYVTVNSLVDGSGAITLNNGGGHFVYSSATPAPLVLTNRPIVVVGGGSIDNGSAFPMTINSSVTASGTGSPTLGLSGGKGGTVNADIDEGAATLGLSVSGPWTLSGSNTYSGTVTINLSATLQVLGTPAMAATNSKIVMNRNATLKLLTDDAGTLYLGNDLEFRRHDTATTIIQNYTVHVGNNGGGTSNSTVVLGKVDFTAGDMRPPRQLNTTGANGYRVQVGDVDLATEIRGTAAGGAQRIRGMTAPLAITGTVQQVEGNSGTQPNANSLYLGGTSSNNLVSGCIADANDYPSNSLAQPLRIYKDESGTWTFTGINTYSGSTTVNRGVLGIDGGSPSQCLPDGTNLIITGSGKVNLHPGVREKVASLWLSGVETNIGTWGSSVSAAQFRNDAYFSGSGILYVGIDIPPSGSVVLFR